MFIGLFVAICLPHGERQIIQMARSVCALTLAAPGEVLGSRVGWGVTINNTDSLNTQWIGE